MNVLYVLLPYSLLLLFTFKGVMLFVSSAKYSENVVDIISAKSFI